MPTLRSSSKLIGITLGDPAGIGPEVIGKALTAGLLNNRARYLVIGDRIAFDRYLNKLPSSCRFLDLQTSNQQPFKNGSVTFASGNASYRYLLKAIELLRSKEIQALVTGPVSKEAIGMTLKGFHGHTELLAEAFHVRKFEMMFVARTLKTVIVTRHMPLNQVSRWLTPSKIFQTISLTHTALKGQFKVKAPTIAVCGFNPHAGEKGRMGKEEITKIIPAIKKALQHKMNVIGPLPADTLFSFTHGKNYDAVIAMYHDQGLIPMKTLFAREAVNLTIGLPFIRTSPAHGTAFDIAGKNKADPSSMVHAINLAARLSA